jgi:hypothetical protein
MKNEGGEARLLHHTHGQTSRNSTEEYGENNSRNHDSASFWSVAGEADGVAGVVSGIVQPLVLGETDAEHEDRTHEKASDSNSKALGN